MIALIYRAIGFMVDMVLYLVFMHRFAGKRPQKTAHVLVLGGSFAVYAVYRLGFGYNEATATVFHNIAILALEAVLCWMMDRWIYRLPVKVSLAESLIFVIAVHVGRKVFFHIVTPLFPTQQVAAQIEMQLLVAVLKIGLVWLVTSGPADVAEEGVKDLELFLLVYALCSCFLMDYLHGQYVEAGWSWNVELMYYFTAMLCGFMVQHTMADHCELLRMTRLEQLRRRQYDHLRERLSGEEEVRRMCHDLKHQLLVLRQNSECTQKMLDQVEDRLERYSKTVYADNSILNVLLQEKAEAAKQEGVEVRVEMRIPPCAALSDVELCGLFGNALDNAVEGARALPGGDAVVHIHCLSEPGFWAVRFQNPYQGKLETRNGLPRTTKADAARHGIGLRSIRTCVEKHGGSMAIDTGHNLFTLSVLVPLDGRSGEETD